MAGVQGSMGGVGEGVMGGGEWGVGSAVTIADLADKLSLSLTENDYSNWQKNCTRTVLETAGRFFCLFVCLFRLFVSVCGFSLSALAVVVFVL